MLEVEKKICEQAIELCVHRLQLYSVKLDFRLCVDRKCLRLVFTFIRRSIKGLHKNARAEVVRPDRVTRFSYECPRDS